MKPKWIIGHTCFDDGNPERFREALQKTGNEVNWFKYVPFEHDKNQNLGWDKSSDCVIAYGSIQLCKLIERATAWLPGSWTPWTTLRCQHYLTYWGQFSIHDKFAFVTLGDFIRRRQQLFGMFSWPERIVHGRIFIKPDDNEKTFHGEILAEENFDSWYKYVTCYEPAMETLCLVSQPANIKREWRTVMANGKFLTGSQYRALVNGESSVEISPDCPLEVQQFCEQIAASGTFDPAPIYCMDIGETYDGLRLVEIGGVNCAGLYDCDIEKVVVAANEIAEKQWNQLHE